MRFTNPVECGKFVLATTADGIDKTEIGVADEILEWRGFTILVSHEQQRQKRREKYDGRGKFVGGLIPSSVVV
jgi:hypothetical protein